MSGLIPQSFIDDLLARTDIVDVVSECVPLKKAGKNHQARCPFHQEKTPSFTVSADKQFYYCFGCGASGNAIGFIMQHHKTTFPEAVDMLAKKLGLTVPTSPKNAREEERRDRLSPLYALSREAARFYQVQYNTHPENSQARNYLSSRKLTPEMIAHFGLGFAPSGWNNLIDYSTGLHYSEKQLEESGLAIRHDTKKTLYDRFRKRIIFPIRDARGRICGFGGRALGDERPKYLNSPETPIFHKGRELYGLYEAIKTDSSPERLIIVEGYMDVIALAQHGICNAVATLGTATTREHITRIFKHTTEAVFCFDGDDAGRKAAWRAFESSLPEMKDGRKIRFLFLPQGEDPDSLVFREGPETFLRLLKQNAKTLDDYLFEHLESGSEIHTLDGKACFAREARKYIQQIPEGTYRTLLANEMARRAELDSQILDSLLSSAPALPDTRNTAYFTHQNNARFFSYPEALSSAPYRRSEPVRINPARVAIRILLKHPRLHLHISPEEFASNDEEEDTRMLTTLIRFLQNAPQCNESSIRGSWHNTPLGEKMAEIQQLDIPEGNPEQMLQEAFSILKARSKKRKLSSLKGKERLKAVIQSRKAQTKK